jgi:hypothetical protein
LNVRACVARDLAFALKLPLLAETAQPCARPEGTEIVPESVSHRRIQPRSLLPDDLFETKCLSGSMPGRGSLAVARTRPYLLPTHSLSARETTPKDLTAVQVRTSDSCDPAHRRLGGGWGST